jgi:hypothetical protein
MSQQAAYDCHKTPQSSPRGAPLLVKWVGASKGLIWVWPLPDASMQYDTHSRLGNLAVLTFSQSLPAYSSVHQQHKRWTLLVLRP